MQKKRGELGSREITYLCDAHRHHQDAQVKPCVWQAEIHEVVAVIVWKPYRDCGAGQIGQMKTALLPHISQIPILK
jgi:hypothetical protein